METQYRTVGEALSDIPNIRDNDDAFNLYHFLKAQEQAPEVEKGILSLRNAIVERNMGLVYSMVRKRLARFPNEDEDELFSNGYSALLMVIEKYDIDRGFKFPTYACRAIYNSFISAGSKKKRCGPFNDGEEEAVKSRDYPPDAGLLEIEVNKGIEQFSRALPEIIATFSNAKNKRTRKAETSRKLTVIEARFGLNGYKGEPLQLKEISKKIGLSKERVRQIQLETLKELKNALLAHPEYKALCSVFAL